MERRSCIWKNRIVLCCLAGFKALLFGIPDQVGAILFVVVIECGSQRCAVEFEALCLFLVCVYFWFSVSVERPVLFCDVVVNEDLLGFVSQIFLKKLRCVVWTTLSFAVLSNSKPSALICSKTSRAISIQLFEFRAFKKHKTEFARQAHYIYSRTFGS